jgi:inosine-uridine nucleoside N-ribohydrolase
MLSIIVDTDVGFDDLLAILYLMNRPDITIEAFTVVNGISTVVEGANALLSLQEMLGIHPYIPVYLGSGPQSFTLPDSFRGEATSLDWKPPARLRPSSKNAGEWLSTRFQEQDATVLAIGPLTNLAQALPSPSTVQLVTVYAMGGAFQVLGDLPPPDPGDVEANIWVDPAAAATVLANAPKVDLVPLDASNQVPITTDFIDSFGKLEHQKPNWRLADQIL